MLKKISAIALLLAMASIVAGALYLKVSGFKALSVQTGSMTPAIRKGDLVAVKSVPDYQVGDVITYIIPDNARQTITHRIVDKKVSSMNTQYTTKGDANMAADSPISASAIVGKVGHKLPYAGYAVDFVRKPLGLILIIYIPALMIMWSEMRRLAAYYKTQAKYVLATQRSKLMGHLRPNRVIMMSRLAPLILLVPLGFSIKTYAALSSTATLTGNTISSGPLNEEPEQPPNNGGTTTTCNSNTNVNVNNTTNQTATSGNVNNSDNTTTGTTTSGNASNTSTNNTTITVNGCSTPAATPTTTAP